MIARPHRQIAWAGRYAAGPQLGNEPPIEADGERHTVFDRRRVSMRWLGGTILTGLAGSVLIAAAIHVALDRQTNTAEQPAAFMPPRKETSVETGINPRKGDRLVQSVDIVAAKQNFKAPSTVRIGDREVARLHSYTRVETTLLTTSAGFADDVPAFNPLKLLADARNPVDVAPEPVQDDAEVTWATRDLNPQTVSTTATLSNEEAEAQVAVHVKSTATVGARPLVLPPQLLLMRTSRANPLGSLAYAAPETPAIKNPFSSIEVRMVPENVTIAPRAAEGAAASMDEKLVVLRRGDTLDDVLRTAGVAPAAVPQIVAAFGARRGEAPVADGRRLKLLFVDPDGTGAARTLARLSVYSDETLETTIALTDTGGYLKVEAPQVQARKPEPTDDGNDDDDGGMRLYDSLYETALKQDIPRTVVDDLVRIFANDVDFQRSVTSGDSFVAFYSDGDEGDAKNDLLYASITTRGETYRYYRFQTPDDSVVDYYDQNGRSTRKFLVRIPILNARITSGFGMRFHPILGYSRPHTGTDFAAPVGTPIFAAGNGTIVKAGWDSGYGRRVEIQHANGYVTTYNHMSGFARGATEGARVRQGQVIGYLGQTGLATGPHLHYEVLVNGHFVDPMRVRLARTREFDGKMLSDFMRERDRIDNLMQQAPSASRVMARSDR